MTSMTTSRVTSILGISTAGTYGYGYFDGDLAE